MRALEVLKVKDCIDLSVLWEDGSQTKRLCHLKRVAIIKCPNLKVLVRVDRGFPCNLEFLALEECEKLQKLTNELCNLKSPTDLRIKNCSKLKFPTTGLLHTLTYLQFGELHQEGYLMLDKELYDDSYQYGYNFATGTYQPPRAEGKMRIYISDPLQLESLLRSMVFSNIKHIFTPVCQNLKCLTNLKHNRVHLIGLTLTGCPRMEMPTSVSECGLSSLSSLQRLDINQIKMVSFPNGNGRLLPTSLKHVSISRVEDLESISRGILNLTSLETLEIFYCTKLSLLPKEGLPGSLQRLDIFGCTSLEKQCSRGKGDY